MPDLTPVNFSDFLNTINNNDSNASTVIQPTNDNFSTGSINVSSDTILVPIVIPSIEPLTNTDTTEIDCNNIIFSPVPPQCIRSNSNPSPSSNFNSNLNPKSNLPAPKPMSSRIPISSSNTLPGGWVAVDPSTISNSVMDQATSVFEDSSLAMINDAFSEISSFSNSPTLPLLQNIDLGDINVSKGLDISSLSSDLLGDMDDMFDDVLGDLELNDLGLPDISFDDFIPPIDSSLLARSFTAPNIFQNLPVFGVGGFSSDILKLQKSVSDTYSSQLDFSALLPSSFSKCKSLIDILGDTIDIPESISDFLEKIKSGIAGPLQTVMGIVGPITDIASIIPSMVSSVIGGITSQVTGFIKDAASQLPFVGDLMSFAKSFNMRMPMITDMMSEIENLMDCVTSFGSPAIAGLLSNQSELIGMLDSLKTNPMSMLTGQLGKVMNTKLLSLTSGFDKLSDNLSSIVNLSSTLTDSNDLISGMINTTDMFKEGNLGEWKKIEYPSLIDGKMLSFEMSDQMSWKLVSDISNNLLDGFSDTSLMDISNYMDSPDIISMIDQISSSSDLGPIDQCNRMFYNLISGGNGISSTDKLFDPNIQNSLTAMTKYFRTDESMSLAEVYDKFKTVMDSGAPIGSFDKDSVSDMLVFIKSNNDTDRFLALQGLLTPGELEEYEQTYTDLTGGLPFSTDEFISDINTNLLGENDPDMNYTFGDIFGDEEE